MATAGSMPRQDYLSITNLKDVFDDLYSARKKWYNIGLQLEMNPDDLDAISIQHREHPDPCFRELLSTWLKRGDSKPTWAILASALKSPTVGYGRLAEDISQKHSVSTCNVDSNDGTNVGFSDSTHSHPVPIPVVFQCPCGYCDLLDYIYQGCRKSSSDPYPFLNPKGLSNSEREDLTQKLTEDTSAINKKFADILSSTRTSLENRNITVEKLADVVRDLRRDIKLHDAVSISKALDNLRDLNAISLFNHEIIDRIVEKLGDDDDKKHYEQFCREFTDFCQRKVFEVSPADYSTGGACGNRKYFVVLTTQELIETVVDVKKAKRRVASLLGLRSSQLRLEGVVEGSIILVFSMPMELSKAIFPLKPAIHNLLQSFGYTLGDPPVSLKKQQELFKAAAKGDQKELKKQDETSIDNNNILNQEGKSLLIVAAEGGHELVLLTLLDGGADIEFIQESSGKSALFFAAENGHHEATAILLAYGADRLQTDKAGKTPYSVAKQRGHEKVCEELEEYDSSKRPSVRTISTQQWVSESVEKVGDTVLGKARTTFQWMFSLQDIIGATKAGDIKMVSHILEYSIDLNALVNYRDSDKHAWTSLMWACDRGYHKIVDLLLAKGADPNKAAKSNGWSSLMLASRRGYLRIVKTLLERGAFPDQQNNAGITALAIAVYEGRTAVALLLLHRGADVNLHDENGWTPLIRASNEGNLKLMKVISDLGGYIDAQTTEGWTSLMVASHYGHTEVVRELAKRNADFNLSTNAGDTALHIATLRKNHAVVKELVSRANLNISNKDGLTALLIATNKHYNDVVDLLLEGGADVHYQHPETKWTAIFYATKNGNIDVFQSLLSYGAKTEIILDKDSTSLSVIDVASYLKQRHVLSAMGTSVDYIPYHREPETTIWQKIVTSIQHMDSYISDLEERLTVKGLKM